MEFFNLIVCGDFNVYDYNVNIGIYKPIKLCYDSPQMARRKYKPIQSQNVINNILKILEQDDLTQAELARRSGLSRQSISNFFRGEHLPNLRILNIFAQALDVEVAKLVEF